MKKTVKKMAMGGPVAGPARPTASATMGTYGNGRGSPAAPGRATNSRRPPFAGNAGGAVRGQDRAAMVGNRVNPSARAGMAAQPAGYAKGGMVGFKPCADCKSPAKCKAAGKCMAKGMKGGGMVKGKKC